MSQSLQRTATLMGAIFLGLAVPSAHFLYFLVPYFIMGMLWIAFLDIRPVGFRREHLLLLALNWAVGLAAWRLLLPFNRELAFAALLIGLTPTATASPVITGMLGGRVEFVAGSVLVTNVAAGVLFPLALPWLLGANFSIETAPFLKQTVLVILVPLLLAQAFRWGAPDLTRRLLRYRKASFYLWVSVLFVLTSNAGQFLRTQWNGNWMQLAELAALSILLCTVNFALGWKMGGVSGISRELSQSLGQKNTVLTIWIALTYVSPLVALGPTFYIIWHNTYNAWQLARCPVEGADAA